MMMQIPKEQAKRFMLSKHGLLGSRRFAGKDGIMEYVKQVGGVQYDPVDVCGKSHELALVARVSKFTRAMLFELLYEDRKLLDFYDKNMCIVQLEDWPCLAYVRRYYGHHGRSKEEIDAIIPQLLQTIHERGHATSQELEMKERVDWYWSETSLSRAALETLYYRGDLVIHHKKGTIKSYALTSDCLPSSITQAKEPFATEQERYTWQVERRIGAVGMLANGASDAWLGINGMKAAERAKAFADLLTGGRIVPVQVDGLKKELYVKAEDISLLKACAKPSAKARRVRLLPPLDCMLWDRKLIEALFGFSYKWEIYTPDVQRKYAKYVLPVLYGERFAGRIELDNDRRNKVLHLHRFWPEADFRMIAGFEKQLMAELEVLRLFHEASEVRITEGWVQESK